MVTLIDKVRLWSSAVTDCDFHEIFSEIRFHAFHRFHEYKPTEPKGADFLQRLEQWLDCAPAEADQQLMLRILPYLFFIGAKDRDALFRAAMTGPITWWLVDQEGIDLLAGNLRETLDQAVRSTWFGAVTDLDIADFHHVNSISGYEIRPNWYQLVEMGDPEKIKAYIDQQNIKRMVLLEDFVGSGGQLRRVATGVLDLGLDLPVLLVPLVVCPGGVQAGHQLAGDNKSLSFHPLISLPEDSLAGQPSKTYTQDSGILHQLGELCKRLHPFVKGSVEGTLDPLGYCDTGALVILFTNCPNNTIPLIWHQSESWAPIFPRVDRS